MAKCEETFSKEYWKTRAKDYELMFLEQQEICQGYREIIEEKDNIISQLRSNKTFDKNDEENGQPVI